MARYYVVLRCGACSQQQLRLDLIRPQSIINRRFSINRLALGVWEEIGMAVKYLFGMTAVLLWEEAWENCIVMASD